MASSTSARLRRLALPVLLAACTHVQASPHTGTSPGAPSASAAVTPTDATEPSASSTPSLPTTPPTAPTTTPTTVAPPTVISLAFSGDTLLHTPLWQHAATYGRASGAAFDFRPMLAPIAPLVATADLAVCHLETPLVPEGAALSTYPLFGVPVEIATALKATGYDRCSTASNHSLDRGMAGIDRTVSELEKAGLHQSGMARTPTDFADRFTTVKGVRIAHLAYTFSYNGLRLPKGEEWRSALIDPDRIVADATAARAAGAQVVIVSLHWGVERHQEITAAQRQLAERLTASGVIDLIVGEHAHVLQPIEQVNGVWVVYGMGNILSGLSPNSGWPVESLDGVVVTTALTVSPDGTVSVARPVAHPTFMDRDGGFVVRPVLEGLADPSTPPGLRSKLAASLARTKKVLGAFLPG